MFKVAEGIFTDSRKAVIALEAQALADELYWPVWNPIEGKWEL